jgi:hypothetical protein
MALRRRHNRHVRLVRWRRRPSSSTPAPLRRGIGAGELSAKSPSGDRSPIAVGSARRRDADDDIVDHIQLDRSAATLGWWHTSVVRGTGCARRQIESTVAAFSHVADHRLPNGDVVASSWFVHRR